MCEEKRCPQCGEVMKCKKGSYQSIADWDSDYTIYYTHNSYKCVKCKIKCIHINEGHEDVYDWVIPEQFLPSEKQIKAVNFINRQLKTDFECHTKRQAWEFINRNLKQSIAHHETDFECWCEDNQEYLPDCF